MNTNGKRARKESSLNRHELKRSMRAKRHDLLNNDTYNPGVGTNARKAARRSADRR